MSIKSLLPAAAAAVATLAVGVGAASAHGNGNHGGHFFHHGFGPRLYIGSSYNDCGYLFGRWQYTGSYYWKHRYFQCRNGW